MGRVSGPILTFARVTKVKQASKPPRGRQLAPRGSSCLRMSPGRAILFIDGNNWFHGLRRVGVDAYDLDYRKVARELLKGRPLAEIRFYIGRVSGDRDRVERQRNRVASLESQGGASHLGPNSEERDPSGEEPGPQEAADDPR